MDQATNRNRLRGVANRSAIVKAFAVRQFPGVLQRPHENATPVGVGNSPDPKWSFQPFAISDQIGNGVRTTFDVVHEPIFGQGRVVYSMELLNPRQQRPGKSQERLRETKPADVDLVRAKTKIALQHVSSA